MCSHDLEDKTDEMASWLSAVTHDELREMGGKGETVIQKSYTKEIVTGRYVELIDLLLSRV